MRLMSFKSAARLGQPFGGLPASAYIPEAAILPTSSPNMFPMVSMPPGQAPILVETYTPPPPAPAPATPSYTPLYWAAGLLGVGLLGYLLGSR